NSWKKYLAEYTFVLWNESNFDIHAIPYTSEAAQAEKWAFVSDYARFYILYHHGGIYLDTDVELLKSLNPLLENKMFGGFEYANFKQEQIVAPGLILGSEAGTPLFEEVLHYYEHIHFKNANGSLNTLPIPVHFSNILQKHGLLFDGSLQNISDFRAYPSEYFCPMHSDRQIHITPNTYSIHHYSGSWLTPWQKYKTKIALFLLKNKIGFSFYVVLLKFREYIENKIKFKSF
ncbi:MAG: glycosyltransferase, partial [Bacteroidales bacterium]